MNKSNDELIKEKIRIAEELEKQCNYDDKEEDSELITEVSDNYSKIDDTVTAYLKTIGNIKLLTPEEEVEIATKAAQGDEEARQKMIESNLRLVVKIAKHYKNESNELMDLIQEGNQGLITAVGRFDVTKGYRFSTYATWWIRQSILRSIMNNGRTIRVSVHTIEEYNKIRRCKDKLTQELYREPTIEEIADRLGISTKKVYSDILAMNDLQSLDAPVMNADGDEDTSLGEFIACESYYTDPEGQYTNQELHDIIYSILYSKDRKGNENFKEKEREIILKRFGFYGEGLTGTPCTLEELGKEYKCTRERIRQIEAKALKKFKEAKNIKLLEGYYTEDYNKKQIEAAKIEIGIKHEET